MKLTKIFGIVLSLHVGVILLVMFQPGCQTVDKKNPVDPPPETENKSGAFNEGLPDGKVEKGTTIKPVPELSEPTRPVAGELFVPGNTDGVSPAVTPLPSNENSGVSDSFSLRPTDLSIYKIVKGDTLWGIARKNNVTLQSLLSSNPNLNKSSRLNIGQEIMIPSVGSTNPVPSPSLPVEPLTGGASYTVMSGDSLSRIARKNGVSLQDLMAINGMNSNSIIRPGQKIIIPENSGVTTVQGSPSIVPDGATTHIVRKGENLTRIATIYGTTVKQIMEWNNILDAGRIRTGQSLVVSSTSVSPSPLQNDTIEEAKVVPVTEEPTSVQDFFKGTVEEKPVIDVPEQP